MSTCYIRRSQQLWTQARPHHRHALRLYLAHRREEGEPGEPGEPDSMEEQEDDEDEDEGHLIPNGNATIVTVPHVDGGTFVASFSHVGDDVYQFVDAYHNTVQIMMCEPNHVAYINRITCES